MALANSSSGDEYKKILKSSKLMQVFELCHSQAPSHNALTPPIKWVPLQHQPELPEAAAGATSLAPHLAGSEMAK